MPEKFYYVRINPELTQVADDPAIQRSENPSREEVTELMGQVSDDPTAFDAARRRLLMSERDDYARIDRVEAFGREFIGGGGEVIDTQEKEALQSEGTTDGKTQDGTPLLVVTGQVGEE